MLKEFKEQLVHKEIRGLSGLPDHKEPPDQEAQQGQRVQQEHLRLEHWGKRYITMEQTG